MIIFILLSGMAKKTKRGVLPCIFAVNLPLLQGVHGSLVSTLHMSIIALSLARLPGPISFGRPYKGSLIAPDDMGPGIIQAHKPLYRDKVTSLVRLLPPQPGLGSGSKWIGGLKKKTKKKKLLYEARLMKPQVKAGLLGPDIRL